MSLPRRLMNMVVVNEFPGAKSLICVDLWSQLFGNTLPPERRVLQASATQTLAPDAINQKDKPLKAPGLVMDMIQLPSPIFSFQASLSTVNKPVKIDCFPLGNGKMFWNDQDGRSYFFEVNSEKSGILQSMPNLHKPKLRPFSLFVPNDDADTAYDHHCFGSTLFLMEKNPEPEPIWNMQQSSQYEAIVFGSPAIEWKAWVCQLVPPPPFVRDPLYWSIRPEISSYAVVGGGKHVCISADGVGSYCLDTETHTWSELGKWRLPFRGKAEYVPELKLWLGFSAEDRQLAAADLSAVGSRGPELVRTSKLLDLPEEWREYRDPELVNLGSGRFCIVRHYFQPTRTGTLDSNSGEDHCGQILAVFTGVEVLRHDDDRNGSGKDVELLVVPYKSICHISDGTNSIDAVL